MTSERAVPEGWDIEVDLLVTVHVRARPGAGFEGWDGRTPQQLAEAALITGRADASSIDGFADLAGSVDVESVDSDV